MVGLDGWTDVDVRDYAVGCEWAEGVNWADRWTTDGRPDRQTDTQKWQMDKELPLNGNPPPQPVGWVPVH